MKLDPVCLAHAAVIQQLASHPDVIATTNLPDPYPDSAALDWIRFVMPRHAAGREYAFAMVEAPGPGEPGEQVVGVCGLVDVSERGAEIGYWVGRPFWSRGYATAACRLLLAFAFEDVGVPYVRAATLMRNAASRRVLAKLGFEIEGVRTNYYTKWQPLDYLALYGLTAEQWLAHRRESAAARTR